MSVLHNNAKKRLKPIRLLALNGLSLFLVFYALSASANNCSWFLKLGNQTAADALNSELFRHSNGRSARIVQRMQIFFEQSEEFNQQYTSIIGKTTFDFDSLNDTEKKQILNIYYDLFTSRFKDPQVLQELRSQSIKRSLEGHGYQAQSYLSGQQELQELSRCNLLRLVQSLEHADEFLAEHSLGHIDTNSINVEFRRNAHGHAHGDFIMSSKEMFDYSGIPGYNTEHSFNREILKSDDNIFFIAAIGQASPMSASGDLSRYGNRTFQLNSKEYARQYGIISPFVMWEREDLERFATAMNWIQKERLKSLSQAEQKNLLTQWRLKLYEYDLTVSDFEKLVAIKSLYEKFLARYPEARHAYMNSAFFRFLKAPIEMKIPVAVPNKLFKEIGE